MRIASASAAPSAEQLVVLVRSLDDGDKMTETEKLILENQLLIIELLADPRGWRSSESRAQEKKTRDYLAMQREIEQR